MFGMFEVRYFGVRSKIIEITVVRLKMVKKLHFFADFSQACMLFDIPQALLLDFRVPKS